MATEPAPAKAGVRADRAPAPGGCGPSGVEEPRLGAAQRGRRHQGTPPYDWTRNEVGSRGPSAPKGGVQNLMGMPSPGSIWDWPVRTAAAAHPGPRCWRASTGIANPELMTMAGRTPPRWPEALLRPAREPFPKALPQIVPVSLGGESWRELAFQALPARKSRTPTPIVKVRQMRFMLLEDLPPGRWETSGGFVIATKMPDGPV